jgi:A/G-specific adenine glycosylase
MFSGMLMKADNVLRVSSGQTISIDDFKERVYTFYRENKRVFAWRDVDDPYFVLVSEIMLQQTQTIRVEQKFMEFVSVLPTFEALACAPFCVVLGLWKGLGYNRRAQWLQRAAQRIVDECNSKVPSDPEELHTFPGIGFNTARSIVTFAFNVPQVFIETNIRTVFIHHFFNDHEHSVHDRDIMPLVEQTLDHERPRQWYYALMDYGVYLKKTCVNPSRRSMHYRKQSRFEGSDRQMRGRVLELLLEYGTIAHNDLCELLAVDVQRVDRIVEQLRVESLIKKHKDVYTL